MKLLLCTLCLTTLLTISAWAGGMSVNELRQIAQAGGSIVVDLEERDYSVTELAVVAAALAHGATLTIRVSDRKRLPVAQCLQIAKTRPGQVCFWFGR